MNQAAEWIARARAFHSRQLATHRRVFRLGKSRIFLTTGQAVTTSGSLVAANATYTAGMPSWTFWVVLVGGYMGGRYAYPIPDNSIASKRGPSHVLPQGDAQLDNMTPEEIRSYENNMMLAHGIKEPRGLGTAQALNRQRQAVQLTAETTGLPKTALDWMSLSDVQVYRAVAGRHDFFKKRWLAYEVDARLQLDYPAMSDASFPPTAAMIRAMRAADEARPSGLLREYQTAVESFREALAAAEAAAGVPKQ